MSPTCARCGAADCALIVSAFTRELVCLPCKAREVAHPRHREAMDADIEAARRGDRDFPGIGLPPDLEPS